MTDDGVRLCVHTQGLNPYQQDDRTIRRVLLDELCRAFSSDDVVEAVYFYGAGCRGEGAERLRMLLAACLSVGVFCVHVHSDLLGAAHALCGLREGVVCILGTGSGTALYDGVRFTRQVPSLGYVLGDEGSGAVLGRRWVAEVFKGTVEDSLRRRFLAETGLTVDELLTHVYRMPMPNRYLASFAPFLHGHRAHPDVAALLAGEFDRFFNRCVCPYARPDLSVHFVGSIAWHFSDELRKAAQRCGLRVGQIEKSPLARLVDYVSGQK